MKKDVLPSKKFYTRLFIAYVVLGVFLYFAVSSPKEQKSTQTSFLSDTQIQTLMQNDAIVLDENISNKEYLKMRKIYEKDIRTHFMDTHSKEAQNKIWANFKKFYTNQLEIQENFSKLKKFKFIGDDLVSYKYQIVIDNITKNSSFLNIYANDKKVRTYEVKSKIASKAFSIKEFSGLLKVYLPYLGTKIMIQKSDKEKIIKINNLMQSSYELLEYNKKLLRK